MPLLRLSLVLPVLVFVCGLVRAMPPRDGEGGGETDPDRRFMKEIDQPNAKEVARIRQRLEWQRQQRLAGKDLSAEPKGLKKAGQDKVLVLLVEFDGTNTFTWTPGSSTWDPLGKCDNSEFDGVNIANSAASAFFAQKYGITGPTNFTYSGPLHNQIPRPLGSNDASATSVWLPDFSPAHFNNMVFGDGVVFDFARQDGSVVYEDFTGKSVRDYYEDLSGKTYTISGTVLGWLKVTNSVWWYGADGLPGARSAVPRPSHSGAIPGAGNYGSLVRDALNSAKAAYPGFDWASYDQDLDGVIDRLWIIHAGYGEEDNPGLINRTGYGESGLWSHSSGLGSPYQVVPGVSANAYIMMPENAGIAVLAHEFAHNLGAIDLYTYGDGQTSAGFWTLMSDSWVGFPLGYLPEGMDPMHLDQWGWLNPLVISDPARVYTVKLGQASRFPGGANTFRAVKIQLSDGFLDASLPVQPQGSWQWWGGRASMADVSLTMKQAIAIPGGGAILEFQTAYDTETGYDFFSVEVSTNNAATWQQLVSWSGTSAGFPAYQARSFSLANFANRNLMVRFRYTTDSYIVGAGPFVDDVAIRSTQVLFSDDVESPNSLWNCDFPWARNQGNDTFTHSFYLQWRNAVSSGGYDQALGDPRFRFGPVNSGMLVWYQDDRYGDNRIGDHLVDGPSFGPKGKLLVVDSHPEPYLDPYWIARGINDERGNVFSRGSMRDAPFSRWSSLDFTLAPPYAFEPAAFAGRPAVHWFSDALGFYPGLQDLRPNLWRTRHWDASVVLPSSVAYGVRGPGYPAGGPVEQIISTRVFVGEADILTYRTNAIPIGSSLPGGSGNPGDANGDFGWNVWIVHQTNATAEAVIWNRYHARVDTDLDGLPDWQEAIAGTDPMDFNSALRMTGAQVSPQDGTVQVKWTSAPNRLYRLWKTTNLLSGFQSVLEANLPATPGTNVFVDSNPAADSPAFYRVEVQ